MVLAKSGLAERQCGMIRPGFLSDDEKRKLTALARNPAVKHRYARRANAILLLDRGMSCQQIADLLFIDDDSVREWMRRYEAGGSDGLQHDDHPGSEPKLSLEQMAELKAFVAEALPRNAIVVADWIKARFGFVYDARSSVPKLLHRLDFVYRKPQEIPLKIDEDVVNVGAFKATETQSRFRALFMWPSWPAKGRLSRRGWLSPTKQSRSPWRSEFVIRLRASALGCVRRNLAIPPLRQSPPTGVLRRAGADALAKRIG